MVSDNATRRSPAPIVLPFVGYAARPDESTREQLRAWAEKYTLLDRPRPRAIFETTRVGEFASHAYPFAAPEPRLLADSWCLWTLLVDEYIEIVIDGQRLSMHPSDSGDPMAVFCAIEGYAEADLALQHALKDLLQRTLDPVRGERREQFVTHIAEFVRSCHIEAVNRVGNTKVTLEEFTTLRRGSFATGLFLDLVEHLTGDRLPAGDRYTAIGVRLRACAADLGGWCNDVLSYPREAGKEDGNNLVLVLAGSRGLELAEAEAAARARIRAQAWEFLDLRSDLVRALYSGQESDLQAASALRWAAHVEALVAGSLTFQTMSRRWQSDAH
ncbi:terpene synthase family protein [Streptomyces sp. NPDC005122]